MYVNEHFVQGNCEDSYLLPHVSCAWGDNLGQYNLSFLSIGSRAREKGSYQGIWPELTMTLQWDRLNQERNAAANIGWQRSRKHKAYSTTPSLSRTSTGSLWSYLINGKAIIHRIGWSTTKLSPLACISLLLGFFAVPCILVVQPFTVPYEYCD